MSNEELDKVYKRGNYILLGSDSQFDISNLVTDCPWLFDEQLKIEIQRDYEELQNSESIQLQLWT